MHDWQGKTALITGAAGGLGRHLALDLGRAGLRLILHDLPQTGLQSLRTDLTRQGYEAVCREGNLRDPVERQAVLNMAETHCGGIDLLINNAGVEFTARFHELSESRIREVLEVNLEVPMALTRLVLPRMLTQHQGHIVNLSSLAGKSGPAFQEPYAATKAALAAFTLSLRASYRGTGVSASVVCPAFVEAGIYTRLKTLSETTASPLLTGSPPGRVSQAVLRCVHRDLPEVIVNRYPMRPALALATLSPRFGAWLTRRLGVNEFFRRVIDAGPKGNPDR